MSWSLPGNLFVLIQSHLGSVAWVSGMESSSYHMLCCTIFYNCWASSVIRNLFNHESHSFFIWFLLSSGPKAYNIFPWYLCIELLWHFYYNGKYLYLQYLARCAMISVLVCCCQNWKWSWCLFYLKFSFNSPESIAASCHPNVSIPLFSHPFRRNGWLSITLCVSIFLCMYLSFCQLIFFQL